MTSARSATRRAPRDATPCRHGLVASVVPEGVAVVEAPPSDRSEELFPEELEIVRRAIKVRRDEFSTARACAREAFGLLGLPPVPIPTAPDRQPVWPPEVVGSLTHTREHCAAAVALRSGYAAIGVDVEADRELGEELFSRICTPRELRSLPAGFASEGRAVAALFSAKESFYKCQFPLTSRFLGFHDVEIELDVAEGVFAVTRSVGLPELEPWPAPRGRLARCCGLLATGLALPLQGLEADRVSR